jgi:hypothetical protein
MKKTWLVSSLFVAGLMLAPTAADAALINFWSGNGNDVLDPGQGGPGAITAITPHSEWGDVSDNAGLAAGTADWISYANTGVGGIIAPDIVGARQPGNETALFQQSFNISSNDGLSGTFNLWILTDDTATVTVTGPGGPFNLFSAFLGQLDPCAPGGTGVPVGCAEADMGVTALSGLANGLYTLNVFAYQTNAVVFGSQYAGNYSQADTGVVPEPASLILLGSGLLGAAGLRKRSKARNR